MINDGRRRSNANLAKGKRFRSDDEVTKNVQKKGGINSGKSRRERRIYTEILDIVQGSRPVLSPRIRKILINAGMDPENDEVTNAVLAMVALSQKANAGDVRALEKILEIRQQDPKVLIEQQRLNLERENLESYSALDEAFAKLCKGGSAVKERTIFVGKLKKRKQMELEDAGITVPDGFTWTLALGQMDDSKYEYGNIYYNSEEALEGLCKALKAAKEGDASALEFAITLADALLAAEKKEDSDFEGEPSEELPY